MTSYEVVQGGMVKAVLLNGAGQYYTISCHVATFVSNLVTAAIESDSNNDNIIIKFVCVLKLWFSSNWGFQF